jgi:hypothetical protein
VEAEHLTMAKYGVRNVTKRNTTDFVKMGYFRMKTNWQAAGDYSVEIWFRIQKDKDGYPESREWEQLLARPLLERDDYFRIESIPFFLKNVSRGDVVRAKIVRNPEIQDGELFQFDTVLDRGGHNTYHLLLRKKHPDDPDFTQNELLKKGLAVEEQNGDFLAVDVPPSGDQQAIDAYLVAQSDAGRWELQDGYLHSIKTTHGSKN